MADLRDVDGAGQVASTHAQTGRGRASRAGTPVRRAEQRKTPGIGSRGPGAIAQHLQRTIGNQVTQALLQRMVRPSASEPVRGRSQIRSPGKTVQREATRPRAVTGAAIIADVSSQTGTQPTGPVTAGSLARQGWESLFSRHFAEPDQNEDELESSHARYFYSTIYGWIDAQHFFAHNSIRRGDGP